MLYYRIGGTAVAYVSGNEVQYGNQGGSDYVTISAGSSEKVRITTTGNVGIGTTNPGAKLHVEGNIFQPSGILYTDHVTPYTGNQLQLLGGGSNYLYINGDVGIGTNSPTERLHIYQSATTSQAYLVLQNNRTRNAAVFTQTTNGGFYTGTSIGTDTLCWQVYDAASGERMRITSDGNVGIGTSSPSTKLNITGTLGFTAGAASAIIRRTDVVGSNGIRIQGNANDTVSDTNAGASIFVGGGVLGDTFEGNIILTAYGSIADENRNTIRFSNRSGVDTVTERMRINYLGNVGIGITNPSARLTVWTPSATGQQVGLRLNNPFGFDNLNTGAKIIFSQDRSAAEDFPMGELGVGQANAATSANGYMYFSTRNTTMGERMRIASDGKVGIGTDSPNRTLTVNGDTQMQDIVCSTAIYLGGTAAANALDDYEEGTWTPTDGSGAGLTITNINSQYTKIGNVVNISLDITYPSTANASDMAIVGLPFTIATDGGASIGYTTFAPAIQTFVQTASSINGFRLQNGGGDTISNATMSTIRIQISATYFV